MNTPSGPWNPNCDKVFDMPPSKHFKPLAKHKAPPRHKNATARRSIKLLLAQWMALDMVAHKTQSFAKRGTRKGNRTWRALIRRIAEGELVVVSSALADQFLRVGRACRPEPQVVPKPAPPAAIAIEAPPEARPEPIPIKRKVGRPLASNQVVPAPWYWQLMAQQK